MAELYAEYKKHLGKCKKLPSKGGYPISQLRKTAKELGIDISVYNTRKEICGVMEAIDVDTAVEWMERRMRFRGIVQLDKYTSTERALGPKAKITKRYIGYQRVEVQNAFLQRLIAYKFKHIAMLPRFENIHPFKFNNIRASVFIRTDNKSVFYNEKDLKASLKECVDHKLRFMILNILLVHPSGDGHATVAIIDTKQRLIEHFDSEGTFEPLVPTFTKWVINRTMPGYIYTKLWGICPIFPQSKADAWDGMCATYSTMYVVMRLSNPSVPAQRLLEYMIRGDRDELQTRLVKFHRYIEERVKGV